MEDKNGYVYILASRPNGCIYIGVTSDLIKRIWEHKQGLVPGFSRMYHTHDLVWYEEHFDMEFAIGREKQLKAWRREWKVALIEGTNEAWEDLYEGLL